MQSVQGETGYVCPQTEATGAQSDSDPDEPLTCLVLQPTALAVCSQQSYLEAPSVWFQSLGWHETAVRAWLADPETISVSQGSSIGPIAARAFTGEQGAAVLMMVVTPRSGAENLKKAQPTTWKIVLSLADKLELRQELEIDVLSTTSCSVYMHAFSSLNASDQRVTLLSCRLPDPPYATLITATHGFIPPETRDGDSAVKVINWMLYEGLEAGCTIRSHVTPGATA